MLVAYTCVIMPNTGGFAFCYLIAAIMRLGEGDPSFRLDKGSGDVQLSPWDSVAYIMDARAVWNEKFTIRDHTYYQRRRYPSKSFFGYLHQTNTKVMECNRKKPAGIFVVRRKFEWASGLTVNPKPQTSTRRRLAWGRTQDHGELHPFEAFMGVMTK